MPFQENPPGDCQASHFPALLIPTQHRMPSGCYVGLLALFMSANKEQCDMGLNLLIKTLEKEYKINGKKSPTQVVYKDDTKGIISLCPETFLPLYGHLLKNLSFKKR